MEQYTEYELGAICSRLSSGKGISARNITDEGEYPVYGGNGLRGYTGTCNFDGDCAIIGRQGAFCGNVRYFNGQAYMTEHAVVCCANEEHNTRYLAYLLSTMNLGRLSGQSAQPGLSVKTLSKQIVRMPSLEQQKKVVSVLSALDAKNASNEKINDNLQQQLHLLFIQIFNGISDDVVLGDVVETTSGGTPSRKHTEYYENSSICWVKSKELLGNYILDTEEHINDMALSKSSAKLLPMHSVLIAMYGATVGAYGIISKSMTCNQAVCALLCNEKYPYTYLFQIAQEQQQKLINMAVGSAQQNISQVLIKQLPLHSDIAAIRKFHNLALPLHKQIEKLQAENRTLSEMRDTLLPQLMSGKLDVSDIEL